MRNRLFRLRISGEQEKAILLRYTGVKYFLEKMISNTAEKIIIEQDNFNVDKELAAYHDRRILNGNDIRSRRITQATKDKISKTLKEKYKGKHYPLFEETKIKIGLANKGKIISQATRDKVSKANKGKKRTEEQRKNISIAKTGQKYKKHVKVN